MRVKRKSSGLSSPSEVTVVSHGGGRKDAFFPTCSDCGTSRMSSIPMGAHAAFKVRDSLGRGDRNANEKQPSMSFSNADAGQPQMTPPVRYNSKLMNSVWGMYNRYSVHNIKSQIAFEKS